jgi:hypothetical protein
MLAINDYLNKAKEGAAGLARNFTNTMLQANNQAFSNLVGGFQQSNNDLKIINQAIMQKGMNGLSPEERQMFDKYYMNPVMGMTNAPEASLGQVARAKGLYRSLNKSSQEVMNPIKNTEELHKLAKEVGVDLYKGTGRLLKSSEDIVNDIIKARKVGATITKDLRVPDIPQIKLQDKLKIVREFLQDKGTGKMAGSKPQPKGETQIGVSDTNKIVDLQDQLKNVEKKLINIDKQYKVGTVDMANL